MVDETTKPMMEITRIVISKPTYGDKQGFTCEITLKSNSTYGADLTLKLDEEKTLAIINHVSDQILEASGIMINDLRNDALQLVEEKRAKELPAPIEVAYTPDVRDDDDESI